MTTQKHLVCIGAGPKSLAIALLVFVLNSLRRPSLKLTIIERQAVGSNWSGKNGYTGKLTRDPDVLDTWFSSALVPFSSLGWPGDAEDLKKYLPSDVLVTGFDIDLDFIKDMPAILGADVFKRDFCACGYFFQHLELGRFGFHIQFAAAQLDV